MHIFTSSFFSKELDDVYHDVSAVVAETMVQGADIMAIKVIKELIRASPSTNCPIATSIEVQLTGSSCLSYCRAVRCVGATRD